MEMHQLRYLLAVAKMGNFSRAAEHCHVSQPSLSQQIQKLEDELGEKLFSRLKRRAVLTTAGEALVPRASRILAEVDAARRDVADAANLLRGSINLGVLPTIAPYLLPQILVPLGRECPGIEVTIHENTTAQLLNMAAACEVDLALISLPIADPRFVQEQLFTEELFIALPPAHRLVKKPSVRLRDIEQERFILMKEGHCLGDQSLSFCDRNGLSPRVVLRSAQLDTIQALVLSGLGVSLIPAMACGAGSRDEPVYRSIAGTRPQRAIGLLWRKEHHHSKAASELLRQLRKLRAK